MKEAVANDFSKYRGTIEQLYKQRSFKRLAVDGLLFCLLMISLSVVPIVIKALLVILLAPLLVMDTYYNISAVGNRQAFIEGLKASWQASIETLDWTAPERLVYEDDNCYYLKQAGQQSGISKKGSRTLPSEIRGISLIIGENRHLFAKEKPLFVVYCDTTEIKPLNLQQKNEAILKNIQWRRFKNKVLQPLGLALLVLIVLLYVLGGF